MVYTRYSGWRLVSPTHTKKDNFRKRTLGPFRNFFPRRVKIHAMLGGLCGGKPRQTNTSIEAYVHVPRCT